MQKAAVTSLNFRNKNNENDNDIKKENKSINKPRR